MLELIGLKSMTIVKYAQKNFSRHNTTVFVVSPQIKNTFISNYEKYPLKLLALVMYELGNPGKVNGRIKTFCENIGLNGCEANANYVVLDDLFVR